jgi:glycosyltransferase involved in cell wall biosynthesis
VIGPFDARLRTLLAVLAPDAAPAPEESLLDRLVPHVAGARADVVWLALAVLRAEYPERDAVVDFRRRARIDGARPALQALLARAVSTLRHRGGVRIVQDAVVVDVHHTARTGLATGIQRVARQTVSRWAAERDVVLTGWGASFDGLHELGPELRERALTGAGEEPRRPARTPLVVPWRSHVVLPELAIEGRRTARLGALAEFSGNRTSAIGFDCVPLTTAETVAPGMAGAFGKNLAALAHFDTVATISHAAGTEYRGWRRMLQGAGLSGPDIRVVSLPAPPPVVTDAGIAAAREVLGLDDRPLLLCVGSHEPRKNHLAVLHAATLLWRAGRDFRLAFVGGNAWRDEEFTARLAQLQADGRPVGSVRAISDEALSAAYRLADASIFPSVNEGYGLPVAESLSAGTPVITSAFGSMQEIAADRGAVLVDPREDGEIAAAIERVLFDRPTRDGLTAQLSHFSAGDWSSYASDLWTAFTGGLDDTGPPGSAHSMENDVHHG